MSAGRPVALVTGSSRGIGRAIAVELAAAGHDIPVHYVSNGDAARETAALVEAAGARAVLVQADLGSASDRERLLGEVRRAFGRLDILVNNAAMAPRARADLLEATEESLDEVLAVNLKGPFLLTRDAARWLLEIRKEHPSRPLSIINISSLSEYAPSVNRGDYCIAKAGLGMVTKLFAARLAEHRIRVNEVRPGIIATDMTRPVREVYDRRIAEGLVPMRRWGEPADVARAVRAIAGPDFEFATALAVDVDGGFHLRAL
jgi:NAD(P)-dependent dehydrogenase (short-subunit alcohol dehydrogenase family)